MSNSCRIFSHGLEKEVKTELVYRILQLARTEEILDLIALEVKILVDIQMESLAPSNTVSKSHILGVRDFIAFIIRWYRRIKKDKENFIDIEIYIFMLYGFFFNVGF